jgi:hypothetical protein
MSNSRGGWRWRGVRHPAGRGLRSSDRRGVPLRGHGPPSRRDPEARPADQVGSPALLEQPECHPRQPDTCDDREHDGESPTTGSHAPTAAPRRRSARRGSRSGDRSLARRTPPTPAPAPPSSRCRCYSHCSPRCDWARRTGAVRPPSSDTARSVGDRRCRCRCHSLGCHSRNNRSPCTRSTLRSARLRS